MLDIKFIRENKDFVINRLNTRNGDFSKPINDLLEKDKIRRELIKKKEEMQEELNDSSKKIAEFKKANDTEKLQKILKDLKILSNKISEKEFELEKIELDFNNIIFNLPNIPLADVPIGKSEQDNKVIKNVGIPRDFDFEIKDHVKLGEILQILSFDTACKITGARFAFLKGFGARLERALINFMLETHAQSGYEEVFVPFLVNRDSLFGTGQLPKFEEELFKCDGDEFYLIPTAEVPITNIHKKEFLEKKSLPYKYVGYTACFRREAGSYGKDTRGLIRNHQFNKVELVKIVNPADGEKELEALLADACKILDLLELPYRIISLCSGDLGFASAKTYDIEVWMPSSNSYREISSCSLFTDFQARRLSMKFRDENKNTDFVYTLNGSGLAVGRTFAAILENYQDKDGNVIVPKNLRKYINNIEKISIQPRV